MNGATVIEKDDHTRRGFWVEHWPIAVIAGLALAIRGYHLTKRILIFDEFVLANPFQLVKGLGAYTHEMWLNSTYNPGWPIVVWLSNRAGGLEACRLPSCLAGALTPVAVYSAARAMRLSRNAGLFAASVIAFSVYQVEYGQQVIPYSAMPLAGAVCVGLVTLLARPDDSARPVRRGLVWLAFVLATATATFIHNAALLLFPPIFLYWAWAVLRPVERPADAERYRRQSARLLVAAAIVVSAASVPWLAAKLGESDRAYLRPFYATSFCDAPIRFFASPLLNQTDAFYVAARPKLGAFAQGADPVYFATTRIVDLLSTYVRAEYLTGDQRPLGSNAGDLPWAYTIAMLAAIAAGLVRALRGRCAPAAGRWVACFVITLALGVVLSALHLYPIGGVRQWLGLSPLLAVTAALGVDSTNRWLSRGVLALGVLWLTGNVLLLPRYYEATIDTLPARVLQQYAHAHRIRDFVCADGLPSLGPLGQLTHADPSLRLSHPERPEFVQLTRSRLPFLMCSLSGWPLRTLPMQPSLHPDIDTTRLTGYTAVPLVEPPASKRWFSWDVVLYVPVRPHLDRVAARGEGAGRDDVSRIEPEPARAFGRAAPAGSPNGLAHAERQSDTRVEDSRDDRAATGDGRVMKR